MCLFCSNILCFHRDSKDFGGNDVKFSWLTTVCNGVATSVGIFYAIPVIYVSNCGDQPPNYQVVTFQKENLLRKCVLHPNDCADIDSTIELLTKHISRDVHPDNGARLETALNTGTGAASSVKGRLARWACGR
jgi:hypothetical protein